MADNTRTQGFWVDKGKKVNSGMIGIQKRRLPLKFALKFYWNKQLRFSQMVCSPPITILATLPTKLPTITQDWDSTPTTILLQASHSPTNKSVTTANPSSCLLLSPPIICWHCHIIYTCVCPLSVLCCRYSLRTQHHTHYPLQHTHHWQVETHNEINSCMALLSSLALSDRRKCHE